jgi:hypothetical protein
MRANKPASGKLGKGKLPGKLMKVVQLPKGRKMTYPEKGNDLKNLRKAIKKFAKDQKQIKSGKTTKKAVKRRVYDK